jgi:hypothetical protein
MQMTSLFSTKNGSPEPSSRMSFASASGPAVPRGSSSCDSVILTPSTCSHSSQNARMTCGAAPSCGSTATGPAALHAILPRVPSQDSLAKRTIAEQASKLTDQPLQHVSDGQSRRVSPAATTAQTMTTTHASGTCARRLERMANSSAIEYNCLRTSAR